MAAPALAAGDAAAIAARLGFVPTNLLRVAARDGAGSPRVLELYPLRRSDPGGRRRPAKGVQPWPTTFWLVDGALSDRLAALERRGHVGRLERRLASAGGADMDTHGDGGTNGANGGKIAPRKRFLGALERAGLCGPLGGPAIPAVTGAVWETPAFIDLLADGMLTPESRDRRRVALSTGTAAGALRP